MSKQYDWDHILMLLDVVQKTSGYPKLKPLMDAAGAELELLANPPEEPEEPEEPKEEGEAPKNDRRA